MKRTLPILFCTALVTALVASNVHAQGADAVHVNAAKTASTKPGNTQFTQILDLTKREVS